MSFIIGQLLPYVAIVVFVVGIVYKITKWTKAPIPEEQVLYPAPATCGGAAKEILTEVVFFRKLFNMDKVFWLGSWLFHVGLILAIIGHLVGIPFEGHQFVIIGLSSEVSEQLSHMAGLIAGILMLAGLIYLLFRRLSKLEVKVLSTPSDYFDLLLLLVIAISGNYMRFLSPIEYAAAKEFVVGILTFNPIALPDNTTFLVHFTSVMILMIYFPFSKLCHVLGTFYTQAISTKVAPEAPKSINTKLDVPLHNHPTSRGV